MSIREPRPFVDVRTGTTVESMVRDLPLALSTRELTHWIDGVVAPRVGELEAFVASHTPADPIAAERDSAAATLLVDVAAAEATKVEHLEAERDRLNKALFDMKFDLDHAIESVHSSHAARERAEAEAARLSTVVENANRERLELEAQIVDLLALEQVIVAAYRKAGVIPEGPPPSTADLLVLVRGPQPAEAGAA